MYVKFASVDAAIARSQAEMRKSTGWQLDNITQFRWTVTKNEDNSTAVLVIPTKEQARLTAAERASLLSLSELEVDHPGWFRAERGVNGQRR